MNTEREVVIVSACRTPYDHYGGAMREVPSIELARMVLEEVVKRVDFPKDKVDEIFYGCCMHAEFAMYQNIPARQAMLNAGFSPETLSSTVDRACCSSMYAVEQAYDAIRFGQRDVCIASGAENMSNTAYLVSPKIRWGTKMGAVEMDDQLFPNGYGRTGWNPVALDAGNVALEYDVLREEQDEWAVRSQQRYGKALQEGKWADEIFPVEVPGPRRTTVTIEGDTGPKPDTTYESLAKLRTIYDSPTITAGNAPGMNTGASAILLMSADKAEEFGLKALAYVRGSASVADKAEYIPRVPATAISQVLDEAKLSLDDIKVIEINEAFAAMPLVSTKILGGDDPDKIEQIRDKTNINGGAIALGHPVGATGARLVMTCMYELIRQGGGYGVASICGGLAQGDCVLIEVKQ
jgi:acetyl-CoA C-acetyltransferase